MDFAHYVSARGCSGGPTPGAIALQDALLAEFGDDGITSLGIYSCRTVAGSTTLSVHAEGRALDLGVTGARPGAAERVLAALLSMGDGTLQRILYNHRTYDAASPRGRPLNSSNPHTDHIHIEESWAAANGEIPLELLLDQPLIDTGDTVTLIVAYRGAQWAVAQDLTSRVGLADGDDVRLLDGLAGGGFYVPAVLSEGLMARIPEVRAPS